MNEHTEQITAVRGDLSATKAELGSEVQKLSKLNTEYLLAVQKCEEQASQLTVVSSQVRELSQAKEALAG